MSHFVYGIERVLHLRNRVDNFDNKWRVGTGASGKLKPAVPLKPFGPEVMELEFWPRTAVMGKRQQESNRIAHMELCEEFIVKKRSRGGTLRIYEVWDGLLGPRF